MRKQAIGIYSMAANVRCEATTYTMPYIEKPIIDTRVGRLNPLPAGQNLMIAVLSPTGFNQEHSVIINKFFIQRGMSYVFSEKKVSTYKKEIEKMMIPPIELQINSLCYDYLNNNGIIKIGTYLKKNMIVVGKINEKPSPKSASVAIMKPQG